MKFVPAQYCSLKTEVSKESGKKHHDLTLQLIKVEDKSVAVGKDFDNYTGKLNDSKQAFILTRERASELAKVIKQQQLTVTELKEKPFTSNPPQPYITSTLQQDANRRLHLTAKMTMQIAQKLYEEGFITYMRTDSPLCLKKQLQILERE